MCDTARRDAKPGSGKSVRKTVSRRARARVSLALAAGSIAFVDARRAPDVPRARLHVEGKARLNARLRPRPKIVYYNYPFVSHISSIALELSHGTQLSTEDEENANV